MRTNVKIKNDLKTHEGAPAARINDEQQLRRSVLSCLLWENEAYEDGKTIADRIEEYAQRVPAKVVHALAVEARQKFNLRHVPLLLLSIRPDAQAIYDTITRADELSELLAVHWRNGKRPVPAQMKKGLARAFTKFDEYALSKYNRDNAVKLRDVLFLTHAKPLNDEQANLWKRLVSNELVAPDTWEVSLSAGADKKETFERLLREEKLGYLALLRNLRNMVDSGVDTDLVKGAILARKGADRVLPFRYITAARHASQYEPQLDEAMIAGFNQLPKLKGKTLVVVDISGSMGASLSVKGELNRMDTACALTAIIKGSCEECVVYATAGDDWSRKHKTDVVAPRNGMALIDAIKYKNNDLGHGGIFLKQVCDYISEKEKGITRMIVITDEQDCGSGDKDRPSLAKPLGAKANYMLNVASARNGIGYGKWTHIDGFSENVVRYIHEIENDKSA